MDNESSKVVQDQQPNKIVKLNPNSDVSKMNTWHEMEASFAQSREVRDDVKRSVRLKIEAQHELLKQVIGTSLDVEKKAIFNEYLSTVTQLEKEFINKMDNLDQQNDLYELETREQYYEFFDKAREDVKKWESKPARYQAEIERIDAQEEKRLNQVKKRLEQIEKKREDIMDQTIKIFDSEGNVESLMKKFNVL